VARGAEEVAIVGREPAAGDFIVPWYYAGVPPPQSKLTAQGQISVPAEIRRKLGIGPGSILEWAEEGERIVVRKAGRYSSEDIHRALFGKRPRTRKLADLKDAIRRHARDKHARR
jgi:AbrB family looped-hinge helix DNA binding protein